MFLLCWAVSAYIILIFGRIIMSFLPMSSEGFVGQVSGFIYSATEPVLGAVRKVLPSSDSMPFDFSPAVVMFGLYILRGFLCP